LVTRPAPDTGPAAGHSSNRTARWLVTGISSVGPAKPHAVPGHIPKPQLHLSSSLRTTVCRQGPVLGRPQERPVKLSSTPPRCLRRWRPPCSAWGTDMPAAGHIPESGPGRRRVIKPSSAGRHCHRRTGQRPKARLVRQVVGSTSVRRAAADLTTLHRGLSAWRRLPRAAGLGGLSAKSLATQHRPGSSRLG
jgi:hypothetical protein